MFLSFVATIGFTQNAQDQFYVFKKDWSPAKDFNSATYFMQMVKDNDSVFICRYYQKFGPMVRQESYKDSGLSIPHGFFAWYNNKGIADSSGYVIDGRKTSVWNYFKNDTKAYMTMWYDKGRWEKTENHLTNLVTYADGRVDTLEKKTTAKTKQQGDTGVNVTQIEAQFQGGPAGWQNYIVRNLHIPDRLLSIGHGGPVTVEFLIDKEGNVKDVSLRQSLEWSADAEAIRLIKSSPKWTPAEQDGRKVYYRQVQSITMAITRD